MRRFALTVVVLMAVVAAGPPLASHLLGWGPDPARLPPRGKTVALGNELGLNVVEVGSGPPVILVHGLPSSAYDWAQMPARLAAHGYRVVAYDRVGFGYSSPGSTEPDRYTYQSNARDLLALMDSLAIEHAALVGWSYGGAVVQTAAAIAPQRVSELVLVAAVGPAHTPDQDALSLLLASPGAGLILKWVASVPPLSRSVIHENLVQAFAGEAAIPAGWADYAAAMLSLPGTLDAYVLEERRRTPDTLHSEELAIPTLIVEGSADTLVPPTVAADLHRRIAGSQLVMIPGGSHMLPVTHPDLLADEIAEFLAHRAGAGDEAS